MTSTDCTTNVVCIDHVDHGLGNERGVALTSAGTKRHGNHFRSMRPVVRGAIGGRSTLPW